MGKSPVAFAGVEVPMRLTFQMCFVSSIPAGPELCHDLRLRSAVIALVQGSGRDV